MTKTPLSDTELANFLSTYPGWAVTDGMLVRTFEAKTFLEGIDFVSHLSRIADGLDHHPDIDIRYRKVTLRLITHDAGNRITHLDAQVATDASNLFEAM